MQKIFRRTGKCEYEEVTPRMITISCAKCGKEFSHAILTCNGLQETSTVKSIIHQSDGLGLGLWLFCSRECAEEFLEKGEVN